MSFCSLVHGLGFRLAAPPSSILPRFRNWLWTKPAHPGEGWPHSPVFLGVKTFSLDCQNASLVKDPSVCFDTHNLDKVRFSLHQGFTPFFFQAGLFTPGFYQIRVSSSFTPEFCCCWGDTRILPELSAENLCLAQVGLQGKEGEIKRILYFYSLILSWSGAMNALADFWCLVCFISSAQWWAANVVLSVSTFGQGMVEWSQRFCTRMGPRGRTMWCWNKDMITVPKVLSGHSTKFSVWFVTRQWLDVFLGWEAAHGVSLVVSKVWCLSLLSIHRRIPWTALEKNHGQPQVLRLLCPQKDWGEKKQAQQSFTVREIRK